MLINYLSKVSPANLSLHALLPPCLSSFALPLRNPCLCGLTICVQDLFIRSRLASAGQTITTFEGLSRHAPMTLSSFVNGYEAAVFGQLR